MSVHAISWVLRHSEAQYGARLVLIVLADHADADGKNAFPSIATIAREAKLDDRQVQRVLVELREAGRIVKRDERSVFSTAIYDVVMSTEIPADALARKEREGGGNLSPPASTPPDVSQMPPKPSFEPSEPSAPQPPEGGRARDRRDYEKKLQVWIEANFPTEDPRRVEQLVAMVRMGGGEVTRESVRAAAGRYPAIAGEEWAA